MRVHEFGDERNPVLLLLPGTMCHWQANFEGVIDELARDFRVAVVSYTGFDPQDNEDYQSVEDELERIESFVDTHYGGRIQGAYGCSLGGSFVAHLVARGNIRMRYGVLGSSDLDQASPLAASLMAKLMCALTYGFVHSGSYRSKLMQRRFQKKMADPDPYDKAFVGIAGWGRYDMSHISKLTLERQFASDLCTPLPLGIDDAETSIHVFYAKKMGEKYLRRYHEHFKDAVIHEQDMRHEEFLALHPREWCALLREILEGIHG